jgi:hypothetical protein
MRNLTDIHQQLSAVDHVYLEKQAEAIKIAEEEDAAGRIMARGFADELAKLAQEVRGASGWGPAYAGGSVPSGNYKTGTGATGQGYTLPPRQQPQVKPMGDTSGYQMPKMNLGGGYGSPLDKGRTSAVPKREVPRAVRADRANKGPANPGLMGGK